MTWNSLELLKGTSTGSDYLLDIKGDVKNHWGLTFRASDTCGNQLMKHISETYKQFKENPTL